MPYRVVTVILVLLAGLVHAPACAGNGFATSATRSLIPFVAAGEMSLFMDRGVGRHQAVDGAKALVATYAATEFLKRIAHEERPDGSDHLSFPSGHASTAFAMATVLSEYHPERKWLAYAAASTIAWSRVELDKHHWHDVLAGAALGYFTAKRFAGTHVGVTPGGLAFQTRF